MKKYFFKSIIVVSSVAFFCLGYFSKTSQALVGVDPSYGGRVLFTVPCTCTPGLIYAVTYLPKSLTIAPLPVLAYVITNPLVHPPGSQSLVIVPGYNQMGQYIPNIPPATACWMCFPTPPYAVPLPTIGTITELGTSLSPGP